VACDFHRGKQSGLFAQPTWQSSAVNAYLSSAKNLPTQYFNSSNRAFPDVSGLGHNYLVFDSGSHEPVDGTSASTPVVMHQIKCCFFFLSHPAFFLALVCCFGCSLEQSKIEPGLTGKKRNAFCLVRKF
jgi:hypothetical protein